MTNNTAERSRPGPDLRETLLNAARDLVDGVRALEVLSGTTEDEFLRVGSRLEDFYGRAATVAELSRSAAGLVSGDDVRRTMDGLRDLAISVSAGSKNSEVMIDLSLSKLKHIADLTEDVHRGLDDLERVTRVLHMLGLSMMIQNASLTKPVRSLRALGEDVRKLSAAIDAKTSQIADETRTAAESIASILSRLRTLHLTRQKKVAAILKKMQRGLSSLSENYVLSSGVTGGISKVAAEVSVSIGNIVTSTQVHDITRQQFESSAREFRDLISTIGGVAGQGGKGRPDDVDAGRLLAETVNFCDRQRSALRNARDHFVSAVRDITGNLKSLAGTVRTMLGKTLEVMGRGSSAGGSSLLRIEGDLDSVRSAFSALSETVEIGNEISEAIIVVARTAGRLAGFTDDVENIGDEIVLIALNAEIKAEIIGQEGRGLAVIAESVQKISVEAQDCIRRISHLLGSITSASDELSDAFISSGETAMPHEKEISKDLDDFIALLRSVNGRMFPVLGECEEIGRGLSADIEAMSGAINVHEYVENVAGKVLAGLLETASAAKEAMRGNGEGIRDLFESRREAEDLLSRRPAGPVHGGTPEFGGNVEFF